MLDAGDRECLDAHAPDDVRATVLWLLGRGYRLIGRQGASTFGAAVTFTGSEKGRPVTVRVVVDRSQWMLDVSAPPDGRLLSLDLLLEAQDPSGEPRAQFISITDTIGNVRPMVIRTRKTEAEYVVDLVTAEGRVAVSAYGAGPDELLAILAAEQRYLTEQTGHGSVPGSTYLAKARERIRRVPGAAQPSERGR